MVYQTLEESVNVSEGFHTIFLYVAEIVPIFIPLVLFAIFIITLLGSFYSQKAITGKGDFPISFAVAGYFTAVVSLMMTLVPNLINTFTIVICIIVAVVGTLWLYLSR